VLAHNWGLPKDLQEELTRQPDSEGRDFIARGVPTAELRYLKWSWPPSDKDLATYRLGKGRVVVLDYHKQANTDCGGPGLTPAMDFDFTSENLYNYYLALSARALLWTARHVPTVYLRAQSTQIGTPPVLVGKQLRLVRKSGSLRIFKCETCMVVCRRKRRYY